MLAFHTVSCKQGTGIDNLRTALVNLISSDKKLRVPQSMSWTMAEILLREQRKSFPVISQQAMLKHFSLCGVERHEEFRECARALHNFGSIIYYDEDPNLSMI